MINPSGERNQELNIFCFNIDAFTPHFRTSGGGQTLKGGASVKKSLEHGLSFANSPGRRIVTILAFPRRGNAIPVLEEKPLELIAHNGPWLMQNVAPLVYVL
jgi:hypothetical protein